MRFAALGPVEVDGGSGPVRQWARKLRLLLAALLCTAGRPASTDQLADVLWGDHPPKNVERAVSWHVHKLRRLLGEPDPISSTHDGYTINVHSGEFDVREFETLVHDAAHASHPRLAAQALSAALALWRGPAYGDLADHPAIRAEANRLNESRLTALERRFDAELALGGHRALIDELTTLVHEHPTLEALRGQLMLALYRSGRQSDALRVFRDGRDLIVAQLGIEPGPALRRLEQAIQNEDPQLEPPPAEQDPQGTVQPVPAELPAPPPTFTGRTEPAESLAAALTVEPGDRATVCTIPGPAGAGKSALAAHVAHRVARHYPDGQLYINLHGATPGVAPLATAEAWSRLLRSLGTDDTMVDDGDLAARYRDAITGKRLLFVFDDARDAEQLRPLLPTAPGCGVIATSRHSLSTIDSDRRLRLGAFTEAEAMQLLEAEIGAERTASEPDAARRLVELCGLLPLALGIAAARLRIRPQWPIATLVTRLTDENRRLAELSADDRTVTASFAVGLTAVTEEADGPAAAKLFGLLGLYPGSDIDVDAAAALSDSSDADTRSLLDTLCESALLERVSRDRYRLHDLLRLYAREVAAAHHAGEPRATALHRLRHHYLATARRASTLDAPALEHRRALGPKKLSRPGTDLRQPPDVPAWVERELANMTAAARQALTAPDPDPLFVSALATALYPILSSRGLLLRELLVLAELSGEAATTTGDSTAEFFANFDLGELHNILGDFDRALAHLERARALSGGNPANAAAANLITGKVLRRKGDAHAALPYFELVLDSCGRTANHRLEQLAWGHLALTYAKLGDYDEAIAATDKELALHKEHNDGDVAMAPLTNLGYFHRRAGRPRQALAQFREAAEAARSMGVAGTEVEADLLWGTAEALHDIGDHGSARQHWTRSATLLAKLKLITMAERDAIIADPKPPMPKPLRS